MWIFAPHGLLMPSTFPADKVEPGYLDAEGTFDLQVRVRAISHLENFIRDFLEPLGLKHSEIQKTPHMDYNARLYMSKADFATALTAMVMDIDYDKFKPTAERKDPVTGEKRYAEGNAYHSVLNSIWGTVCRLGSPGGWWGPKSSSNPGGYTSRERAGEEYDQWWKDRTSRLRDAEPKDDDLFPEARPRNWWNDPEFGGGSLADEVGTALTREDIEALDDSYSPSSEERKQDALLTVSGIPADQWTDFLRQDEMDLVRKEHEAALANERRERRRTFLGRRVKKDRDKV